MDNDTIRVFALSKLGWIRRQQNKLRGQERETPREYLDRESHYVWGKRYLLEILEKEAAASVTLTHHSLLLQVRPAASVEKREAVLEAWYRETLRAAAIPLIARWEPILGVKVEKFFVQKMRTKWGSCSHASGHIRLNTDLAKKPPEFLDYILVHEMVHLLEPTHNVRFVALMDRFLPRWQSYRSELNRLPVKHEVWAHGPLTNLETPQTHCPQDSTRMHKAAGQLKHIPACSCRLHVETERYPQAPTA